MPPLPRLYDEIGFARSLLAYRLPDGRLKLIDGHLRQSMSPTWRSQVEVLDVTDAEARALLLAIDPLAQLAGYDAETLDQLRAVVEKRFRGDEVAVGRAGRRRARRRGRRSTKQRSCRRGSSRPRRFADETEQMAPARALPAAKASTCQAKIG